MRDRIRQSLLIFATVAGSWFGMQMVHELGHITAAKWVGARIDHVALHPLTISHTDVGPNDHPLFIVWAGPLVGVSLPLVLWVVAKRLSLSEAFLLRFFAGFCLVANGVYLGVGSFSGIGDCGEMLRNGSPIWTLWLFGVIATVAGFLLWNGQGKHFGLGPTRRPITRHAAAASAAACILFVALGLFIGGK